MTIPVAIETPRTADDRLPALHLLLGVQSFVIVLVSINRKTDLTTGYVADNEFLRWIDLLNMLVLPLVSVVAFVLVRRWIEARIVPPVTSITQRAVVVLDVVFMVGVYLLAAGYGAHEVTNYLHVRFCLPEEGTLCRIVAYNDDQFSHYVFFAGFVLMNVALLVLEAFTPLRAVRRGDAALIVLNALFVAAGVFANLALEPTGLDLPVIAVLVAVTAALWIRQGRRPLVLYYATAYGAGLGATGAYQIAR